MSTDSTVIDQVSAAWESEWGQTPPIAFRLRSLYPDRWVRFHSLPGSKRYAETDAERAEVLSRHQAVLAALVPSPQLTMVWPMGTDSPMKARSDAVLWKVVDFGESFEEPLHIHVGRVPYPSEDFDTVLSAVADDEVRYLIVGPSDLRWLYHPYDGGADVIAATTADRDRIRTEFSSWLSAHPEGL